MVCKIEFERVTKLKFVVAKDIFYRPLNISYNFRHNYWYYCSCDKFSDCAFLNGELPCCYVYQIHVQYDPREIKKIKNISKIINLYLCLNKDLKKCVDFEPTICHFLCFHYISTWRGLDGDCSIIYIDITIDFQII